MKIAHALLLTVFAVVSTPVPASQTKTYDFTVFLDDKEIGHHRFAVFPRDTLTHVTSEARFNVTFLFINAYTYLHSNTQIFRGECLRAIDATTDDNGDAMFVRGEYSDQKLVLQTHAGKQQLVGCISTFAYWNPELLDGKQLLNPQTGELMAVDFQALGESSVTVRGKQVPARQYRIDNPEVSIDLWYDGNQEWVALESTTKDGARLRYQIQ